MTNNNEESDRDYIYEFFAGILGTFLMLIATVGGMFAVIAIGDFFGDSSGVVARALSLFMAYCLLLAVVVIWGYDKLRSRRTARTLHLSQKPINEDENVSTETKDKKAGDKGNFAALLLLVFVTLLTFLLIYLDYFGIAMILTVAIWILAIVCSLIDLGHQFTQGIDDIRRNGITLYPKDDSKDADETNSNGEMR